MEKLARLQWANIPEWAEGEAEEDEAHKQIERGSTKQTKNIIQANRSGGEVIDR